MKGCDFIKTKKIIFVFAFFILFNLLFITPSYAAEPKIVSKLNSAFESIEEKRF